MEQSSRNSLMIPLAIVIAGAFIAGAIFITKNPKAAPGDGTPVDQANNLAAAAENMEPITAEDHIWGNPNATVKLVVYTDPECPFCQRFEGTLKQVMDTYGKDGKVAVIYRPFIVVGNPQYHPKAAKEAEALECAAEAGGNAKYLSFYNLLMSKKDFTKNPAVGVDPADLPKLATSVGIDKTAFTSCLDGGKFAKKIADSYDLAVKAGGQGTPYTIMVAKDLKVPIQAGAIPFPQLKSAIDAVLAQVK